MNKDIETFKANLRLEIDKAAFRFNTLHVKRAEVVAKLYELLDDLDGNSQLLKMEFELRTVREGVDRAHNARDRKPWEMVQGIHTLTEGEFVKIQLVLESARKAYEFYRSHKIYFPKEICEKIDQLLSLANYTASVYENVALKREDGEQLVDSKVLELWQSAHETIPEVLSELEGHFRSLLGAPEVP